MLDVVWLMQNVIVDHSQSNQHDETKL